jgi:hypothetical protein
MDSIVMRSADGRYTLTRPIGGNRWWELTDTKKDYAVVCVQADTPNAQRVAEAAFELVSTA